jgi:hypothetical protein
MKTFTLGSLLATLAGCPLLEIEADVPEVCLTYAGVAVEGLAGATQVERSFVFDDLAKIEEMAALDADLVFVRAAARPVSGIDSLGFVDTARVSIASGDAESTLPELRVYDCDGDCAAEGSIAMPAAVRQDALEYVATGSILVAIELAGALPRDAWTMDVDVCVQGNAKYTLEP